PGCWAGATSRSLGFGLSRNRALRRGHLVPQLGEQVAGHTLERATVVLGHLVAPLRELVRLWRILGEQVPGEVRRPLKGQPGLGAADLLAQPLARALVVLEHRRVEFEIAELADRAKHPLGVQDQFLEANLEVM